MKPGKLAVVTVLFNSSSVLKGFFASLRVQQYNDFHVWAIDNASTDDSVTQCRAEGDRITVIANSTNLGVAAGNNQGIHAALDSGCAYVLLLNNDVEFGRQLFLQLVEGIQQDDYAMAAPLMYYFDRPDVIWAAGGKFQPLLGYRCYHLAEGVQDVGQFTSPHRIKHAPTCCVLIKRSVFDVVGFMDERYFVYHDDTDFMLRCLQAGQQMVLLPHAKLFHKVSSLTGGSESEFSIRMGTRNRVYMLSKFLGRALALPYVAGLALTYIIRRLLRQYDGDRYRLKQASLSQGFKMATNWLPYKRSQPAIAQGSQRK